MTDFTFDINPLEHMLDLSRPPTSMPFQFADYPSLNLQVDSKRIRKRPGFDTSYKDLGDNVRAQYVVTLQEEDEVKSPMCLTHNDLIKLETASGKTWSYKTEMGDYDDSVASISTITVTFKASTVADSEDIVAGDYFILDADDLSDPLAEPEGDWGKILTVNKAGGYITTLVLTASYSGTTGTWTGSEKDCLIRRVYTMPTNDRWSFALAENKLFFTNGNTYLQYYDGVVDYATVADSTNAINARYCLEFGDRLILADLDVSGTRNPWTLRLSSNTDFTDFAPLAGPAVLDYELKDTKSIITGLGKSGPSLNIYFQDAIQIGYRTSIATDPLAFNAPNMGIGLWAPYSLVNVRGTQAFLGRDDFYLLNGDTPEPIGERVRFNFFDLVDENEIENVWGVPLIKYNMAMWFAKTSDGMLAFTWDYKDMEWNVYEFWKEIAGFGV